MGESYEKQIMENKICVPTHVSTVTVTSPPSSVAGKSVSATTRRRDGDTRKRKKTLTRLPSLSDRKGKKRRKKKVNKKGRLLSEGDAVADDTKPADVMTELFGDTEELAAYNATVSKLPDFTQRLLVSPYPTAYS